MLRASMNKKKRLESWRMIMILALQNQWLILQWDIEGAFLNVDINVKHSLYVPDESGDSDSLAWARA